MSEQLKLEAGKYYRTRDGRKAFVGYISPNQPDEHLSKVVGELLCGTDWSPCSWRVNGDYINDESSACNLIAEWKDTPMVVWVNVYDNGDVKSYITRSNAENNADIRYVVRKAVKFAEVQE